MTDPIYIRGRGAITPLCSNWEGSARELAAGSCGIAEITHFDVQHYPCTVAASIPAVFPDTEDRRLALARVAAEEAWSSFAPSAPTLPPERLGVFIGVESGRASLSTLFRLGAAAGGGPVFNHRLFGRDAQKFAQQIDARMVSPAAVAAALADYVGAKGPARTISLACASSSAAIIEAVRAIRLGVIDTALCGGVGADVDPLMLVGFGLLGILSSQGISRPFDTRRDGFIIGEGAAMLVLSRHRGDATAAITGVGRSLDAHHLTAPAPDGDGAYRAMSAALTEAGADDLGYIQAHGTSTALNDPIEIMAIQRALGSNANQIPLASVKGALGHWVAGAGALGVLCGLEALTNGVLLPTAGLARPDPQCAMNHITEEALRRDITKTLVNAFAFGGANCSIVMERCG